MHHDTVDKDVANTAAHERPVPRVLQKIWLPKTLYDLVPWFYVSAGLLALCATIYINHWAWVVPHYVLFSAVCLHVGILVFRRRWTRKV